MHIYTEIYEFAASAGTFEGYVYPKNEINPDYLLNWVEHFLVANQGLPFEVRNEFQSWLFSQPSGWF